MNEAVYGIFLSTENATNAISSGLIGPIVLRPEHAACREIYVFDSLTGEPRLTLVLDPDRPFEKVDESLILPLYYARIDWHDDCVGEMDSSVFTAANDGLSRLYGKPTESEIWSVPADWSGGCLVDHAVEQVAAQRTSQTYRQALRLMLDGNFKRLRRLRELSSAKGI